MSGQFLVEQSGWRQLSSQTADSFTEWAPAKINLFLNVLRRRADGYHEIETVYQSIALGDRLTLEPDGKAICLECSDPSLPVDRNNLVVKAVERVRERFPDRTGGLRIRLEKVIPAGSGLGGGSADAAATLRACNRVFGLGLSSEALRDLAAELGMDVPFLVEGGCAIGRGRGESLEPLESVPRGWVVLVVPAVSVSTQWAYQALSRRLPLEPRSVRDFTDQLCQNPVACWGRECFNAFESVVFPHHPELVAIRDALLERGCDGAFLSGSGSAVVGLTGNARKAGSIAAGLAEHYRFVKAVPFLESAYPGSGDGLPFTGDGPSTGK